jgi:hypothetical protein
LPDERVERRTDLLLHVRAGRAQDPERSSRKFDESNLGYYKVTLNGVLSVTGCQAGKGADADMCSVAFSG